MTTLEKRQRDYIAFLQERNRLKRELERRRSKQELAKERRERGFQTCLSGANQDGRSSSGRASSASSSSGSAAGSGVRRGRRTTAPAQSSSAHRRPRNPPRASSSGAGSSSSSSSSSIGGGGGRTGGGAGSRRAHSRSGERQQAQGAATASKGSAWAVRRSKVFFKSDRGDYVKVQSSVSLGDGSAAAAAAAAPAPGDAARLAQHVPPAGEGEHAGGEYPDDEVDDYEPDYEDESDGAGDYLEDSFEDEDDADEVSEDKVASSLLSVPESSSLVVDVMRSVSAEDISALRESLAGALTPRVTPQEDLAPSGGTGGKGGKGGKAIMSQAASNKKKTKGAAPRSNVSTSSALVATSGQVGGANRQSPKVTAGGGAGVSSVSSGPTGSAGSAGSAGGARGGGGGGGAGSLGGVRQARGSFSDAMRRYRPSSAAKAKGAGGSGSSGGGGSGVSVPPSTPQKDSIVFSSPAGSARRRPASSTPGSGSRRTSPAPSSVRRNNGSSARSRPQSAQQEQEQQPQQQQTTPARHRRSGSSGSSSSSRRKGQTSPPQAPATAEAATTGAVLDHKQTAPQESSEGPPRKQLANDPPPAATKAGGALSGLMSQIMTLEQTQQQALLDMLEQLERSGSSTRRRQRTSRSGRRKGRSSRPDDTGTSDSAKDDGSGDSGGGDGDSGLGEIEMDGPELLDSATSPSSASDHRRHSNFSNTDSGGADVGRLPAQSDERVDDEIDDATVVSVRMLSTWTKKGPGSVPMNGDGGDGISGAVGLTEVELFDPAGARVEVDPGWLHLRRIAPGSVAKTSLSAWPPAYYESLVRLSEDGLRALGRLTDGCTKTVSDRHMWRYDRGTHMDEDDFADGEGAGGLALEIHVPKEHRLHKLVVWNYNKSLNASAIGARSTEVTVDGELRWQGEIRRGCGNAKFDYSTAISLVRPSEDAGHAERGGGGGGGGGGGAGGRGDEDAGEEELEAKLSPGGVNPGEVEKGGQFECSSEEREAVAATATAARTGGGRGGGSMAAPVDGSKRAGSGVPRKVSAAPDDGRVENDTDAGQAQDEDAETPAVSSPAQSNADQAADLATVDPGGAPPASTAEGHLVHSLDGPPPPPLKASRADQCGCRRATGSRGGSRDKRGTRPPLARATHPARAAPLEQ